MAQICHVLSVTPANPPGWVSPNNIFAVDNAYTLSDSALHTGDLSGWFKVTLEHATDPGISTNHRIRIWSKIDDTGSTAPVASATMFWELHQFTGSGTDFLIQSGQYPITAATSQSQEEYSLVLNQGNVQGINNYSALRVYFRVRVNAGANGVVPRVSVNALQLDVPDVSAPELPTGIQASDGTFSAHVKVDWAATQGADEYEVYRSADTQTPEGQRQLISGANLTATTFLDTTAVAPTHYRYYVKGKNGSATSGFSAFDVGWRAIPGTIVDGAIASFRFLTIDPNVTALVEPPPATFKFETTAVEVTYPRIPAAWRDAFGFYDRASDSYHLGLLHTRHPTLASSTVLITNEEAYTDHLRVGMSDGHLTRYRYDDSYISAFGSSHLWTSTESGGSPEDRPETILVGTWLYGAAPTFDTGQETILYEISVPQDEKTLYNPKGWPNYRTVPIDPAITTKEWRGPRIVFGPDDLGGSGINKTLTRVTLWVIPSTEQVGDIVILVEPQPVQMNNGIADLIVEELPVPVYAVADTTPDRPVMIVYQDFDPAKDPTVSGHATGEAFYIQINFTNCLGICRVKIEYEVGGEIALLDRQV